MSQPHQPGLLEQLEALRADPPSDPQQRRALLHALREAEYAVEQPLDTVHRLSWAPLQSAVARTAIDLKLFDIIAAKTTPVGLDELAERTGAKPLLLRRLLRFLSLNGMLEEVEAMWYRPNGRTRAMADRAMQAGLVHNFDVQGVVYLQLPGFLKGSGYADVEDATHTAFQAAYGIDRPAMEWAMTQPALIQEFSVWMAGVRAIAPSWLDVFPAREMTEDTTSMSALFVDVGGSLGHQCEELKKRFPDISRPVVLQDLAPVVEVALHTLGVENQVYDFFTPQPVRNASFYYVKSVLHDWPDDAAMRILEHQVTAMGPRSKILLDEIVLPEKGGHWRAAEMDIALLACAASFERTERQWQILFDRVGLKKVAQYEYDDQMLYAIQVLEKV